MGPLVSGGSGERTLEQHETEESCLYSVQTTRSNREKTPSMPGISIVIPAYNEEDNVVGTLEEVSGVARRLGTDHEIIVVDDGSADRTGEVVREAMSHIPGLRLVENRPNRGYGGALKSGFEAATMDYIAFVPADGQFRFSEITSFLQKAPDADIVCGYRAFRRDNLVRRLNGWGWNMVVRMFFGYLVRDVDCGFKLLRREVVERIEVFSDGAMIDTELLAKARARRMRIAEVPVTHLPRRSGEATGANLRVILRAFRDLWALRREMDREVILLAPKTRELQSPIHR